jgi:hypothetical protein
MLKPYKSRVRGTYDVLRYTVDEIGKTKLSLFEANKRAERETIERGKTYDLTRNFPLQIQIIDKSEPFNLKGIEYNLKDSEISGTKQIVYGIEPFDIKIPRFNEAKIAIGVKPPLYYIIPPQWTDVINILQLHDIKFQRIAKPLTIEVESYRLTEPKWSSTSFEGRLTMSFKTIPIKEMRIFPQNSVIVPLAQESANVAIHLLEPNSTDSFVYWGFFNPIFEQKEYGEGYVIEKLAREMLAKDGNLRKEFKEKLKDENFAKSPSARLNFFYLRSPYFDKRIGLYPVGRVTSNLDSKQ